MFVMTRKGKRNIIRLKLPFLNLKLTVNNVKKVIFITGEQIEPGIKLKIRR